MTVFLSRAEAKRLGIEAAGGVVTARRPRRRVEPYHTRCHDCGVEFTVQARETEHLQVSGHARYDLVVVSGL